MTTFIKRNIPKQSRNGWIITSTSTTNTNISGGGSTNPVGKDPRIDKWFYEDETGNLHTYLSFVGDKEISAYGEGSSSGGGGSVTIIDNLTSTAKDAALSANMGRELKSLIDSIEIGDVDLSDYYTKTQSDSKYVTALGTSGNYLTWTKNGTTTPITVPYATNAGTLSGKYLHASGQNPYGKIPFIMSDGVMEIGKYLDFHTSSNDNRDYAVRLQATNTTGGATVTLPSKAGTLALLTDNVASATNADKLDNYHEYEFFRRNKFNIASDKDTNLFSLNGSAIDTSNPNYKGMYVGFGTTSSNSNILLHLECGSNPKLLYNYVIDSNRLGGSWKEFVFNTTPGNILKQYEINTVGLDEDTYYPVTIPLGAAYNVHIEINVSLDGKSKPTWSTHNSGFSVRKVWMANGSAYGQNKINRRVLVSDYLWAKEDPVRGIGQLSNSSNEYVYVRGGAKYQFYISNNFAPTLHKEKYTTVNQSIEPIKRLTDTGEISSKLPALIVPYTFYSESTIYKQDNNGNFSAANSFNIMNTGSESSSVGYKCNDNLLMRFNGSNLILSAKNDTIYLRPNGTASPTGQVTIDKSGNVVASGEVTAYSDERLKTNITPLENRGYITPVTYIKNNKSSIGFVAQEVKEKYPELVIEDNTDNHYLSLNYAQYTAVLQAQIIELNNVITDLKRDIELLKQQLK